MCDGVQRGYTNAGRLSDAAKAFKVAMPILKPVKLPGPEAQANKSTSCKRNACLIETVVDILQQTGRLRNFWIAIARRQLHAATSQQDTAAHGSGF